MDDGTIIAQTANKKSTRIEAENNTSLECTGMDEILSENDCFAGGDCTTRRKTATILLEYNKKGAHTMRIICAKDYQEVSRKAANLIAAQVILKPDCVLGLATGSSPIGAYEQLIRYYESGDLDFSQVHTVNLDEYVGLDATHPQSYAYFMRHNLFDHVNIDPRNTNIPNGMDSDAQRECSRYNEVIRSLGGVDLQLLGLGPNGHIGFNEPCDEFIKGTHRVELTESTINANARFFESMDDVPRSAYTMGILNIMQAKRVVMVANGTHKAQAVLDAFCGPVTPKVPASILQLHPDFTLVVDEAAMSLAAGRL